MSISQKLMTSVTILAISFATMGQAAACNFEELKINMSWSYHNDEDGFRSIADSAISEMQARYEHGYQKLVSGYQDSQDHNDNGTMYHIDGCDSMSVVGLIREFQDGKKYHM